MEHALENRPLEPGNRFQNSNLAQAWLVLVMALFFGVALAAVQVNLSGIISKNKLNETLERIPELVWGPAAAQKMTGKNHAVEIIPGTLTIEAGNKTDTYSLFQVTRQKRLAGWVIKAGGQGYADKIELLIGVDPEVRTLTGLFILDQKETPGLGNKITFPAWRHQFVDKRTDQPLAVVKGGPRAGNTIDAVTGATISSRSVTRIVNRVMAAVKGKLTPDTVKLLERQK
jgi:electron transport complex protein RnfG